MLEFTIFLQRTHHHRGRVVLRYEDIENSPLIRIVRFRTGDQINVFRVRFERHIKILEWKQ